MHHTSIACLAVATFFTLAPSTVNAQCTPQWDSLGTGIGGSSVRAMLALPNGDIIVGGDFFSAGGVTTAEIARWDGVAWSAMGAGLNGQVSALTLQPNGDVVAGGDMPSLAHISRWDGTAWQPLGAGLNNCVRALTTLTNGDIVAGGDFTSAGGVPANYIARWDGANWSSIGGTSFRVFGLTTLGNGDVVASGTFGSAGGVTAYNIARWNGATWSAMGLGLSGPALGLEELPNGDLIAVGGFAYIGVPAGGMTAQRIARWNGFNWSPMGAGLSLGPGIPGPSGGSATTLPNGDLIVGGFFNFVDGVSASNIARWDGSNWFPLGAGTNNSVSALAAAPNGDLLAGGAFTSAGGVFPVNMVARWGGCLAAVPTLGAMGLSAAALLLAVCGVWVLGRRAGGA